MEYMGISTDSDKTWMKFADMMVETGVISDCIENAKKRQDVQDSQKSNAGS
jgi:hypothetical protein